LYPSTSIFVPSIDYLCLPRPAHSAWLPLLLQGIDLQPLGDFHQVFFALEARWQLADAHDGMTRTHHPPRSASPERRRRRRLRRRRRRRRRTRRRTWWWWWWGRGI